MLSVVASDIDVVVEPAAWECVRAHDADELVASCAGPGAPSVSVALAGIVLDGLTPAGRAAAGLGTATGRFPAFAGLRVLDVVLLGGRAPRPSLWQTVLGSAKVRAQLDDEEAAARALAGRLGLAEWIDHAASDLPENIVALADVTRALAGSPAALVWRRPQWLPVSEQDQIADALAAEQAIRGIGILEVIAASPATLPEP